VRIPSFDCGVPPVAMAAVPGQECVVTGVLNRKGGVRRKRPRPPIKRALPTAAINSDESFYHIGVARKIAIACARTLHAGSQSV